MANNLPTTKEFLLKELSPGKIETLKAHGWYNNIISAMNAQTKFHVDAALKAAGLIANQWENSGELAPEILNAYPLENIK